MGRMRFVLCLAAVLACGLAAAADEAAPKWPLAVRLMSYGPWQDDAWEHLKSIGVRHVFMQVPAPEEADALMAKLKAHGLDVPVFRGDLDLTKVDGVAALEPQLAVCEKMGAKCLFLSAKPGETPRDEVVARLRAAGEAAKKHGVTLTLETHPPPRDERGPSGRDHEGRGPPECAGELRHGQHHLLQQKHGRGGGAQEEPRLCADRGVQGPYGGL